MLEIISASKCYGRGTANQVQALQELSLTVDDGEWLTVIGSNGAGKTTLLNVIGGAVLPDTGQVRFDGRDWTRLPEHARACSIGRVEQDPRAITSGRLTVEENLAIALTRGRRRGLRFGVTRQRREMMRESLARLSLGLEDRLAVRMNTLSGGQRQAVAMLMATITRPQLLLLDEHVAALDPHAGQLVMGLTEDVVRREGLATVMVTHNMEQALRYGDRLVMLHAGRILFDVQGTAKTELTVQGLMERFSRVSGQSFADDEALLVNPL